jgi:hypothetical protein
MTVPVPVLQKNRWQQIVYDALPDAPFTVTQTGPMEFKAIYADEVQTFKVRFVTDDAGEEHEMNLFPLWENQKLRIQEAFGCEMVPDDSKPPEDGVLYVRSADGSPPDPLFERILTRTLGDDPTEFKVRVRRGDTVEAIRKGLKSLHPTVTLDKMWIENAIVDDGYEATDWVTQTGTSDIREKWTLGIPAQRFKPWKWSGPIDIGDEDLDGRSREEIWQSLSRKCPELGEFGSYRLYVGQNEVNWTNLPVNDLVIVPTVIPVIERGQEFAIVNHTAVKRPQEVGRLTVMSYQIFTIEKTPFGEPVQILAPNEITLAQLVTYFILPSGIQLDVGSVFYWSLEEVPDPSRDRNSRAKSIKMIAGFGKVDTMVIRNNATLLQITNQWKTLLEIPADMALYVRSGDGSNYFWTYHSNPEIIPCAFRATNARGNAHIFDGSDQFRAEQMSRILDIKMPPIVHCQTNRVADGVVNVRYGGEVAPLGLRILSEHSFSWNLEGRILKAPQISIWWVPYNRKAIMSLGHTVNSDIPDYEDQAEFPPEPWPERVTIRLKSQAPPQVPTGGDPSSPASGSPLGWKGVALGQAQPINADASGLVGYTSPSQGQDGTQLGDLPPDQELARIRGEDREANDEEVHRMIGWTTRVDYPLWIGISMPIPNADGRGNHEGQLWEEFPDETIVEEYHTDVVSLWLMERLKSRTREGFTPPEMPFHPDEVTLQTWKDGQGDYILFTPDDANMDLMKTMEMQVMIEYDAGYMRVGMGNAY